MKQILTIADLISIKEESILTYICNSLYKMPSDFNYPSIYGLFIVVEDVNELLSHTSTPLSFNEIPTFEILQESIELIEYDSELEIYEIVLILDYNEGYGISLIIKKSIIDSNLKLQQLRNNYFS